MRFNSANKDEAENAKMYLSNLINNKMLFDIAEIKNTRSNQQNSARWLYLEMIASILNEQGHTYNPPNTKIEVKFTKDLLYTIYWQTLRNHMFPNKTGQLNTKEFTDLVEMVQMMFAKVFEINIPFPNINDLIDEQNDRN